MKWGLERFRGYKPRLKPCLPWKGNAGEEEDNGGEETRVAGGTWALPLCWHSKSLFMWWAEE